MKQIILFFCIASGFYGKAQIKISSQKNVDFANYKTFAVQKGQIVSKLKEKKVNENKLFEVMKESISREMMYRGYALVADSSEQLIITYFLEEGDHSNYQKTGPLGQTPIDDPTFVNERNRDVISRTLIIEIEDRRNKSSLWTATCTLDRSQKDVYSLVDATVSSVFRKFKSGKK
jgi:hypothetical protein